MKLSPKVLTVIGLAVLVVTAVAVGAAVYYNFRLKSRGSVRTVGLDVFADPNGTIGIEHIDWGMLNPGGYSRVKVYFQSWSNVKVNCTFATGNWTPPAAEAYMTLTWDLVNPLPPEEIRPVTLQLNVAVDVWGITDFSFDIIISTVG